MGKTRYNEVVGRQLRVYRERLGLSKKALAAAMGVSYAYVNNTEAGRIRVTSGRVEQFIKHLRLEGADAEALREQNRIARSPEDVQEWLKRRTGLVVPIERVTNIESVPIPVIARCPAGDPKDYTDGDYPPGYAEEFVPMPASDRHFDPATFLLRIEGDSMMPLLKAGDLVLVSPAAELRREKPCVYKIDDECACKLWLPEGDEVILRPLNPRYRDRRVLRSRIMWAYPVIKAIVEI